MTEIVRIDQKIQFPWWFLCFFPTEDLTQNKDIYSSPVNEQVKTNQMWVKYVTNWASESKRGLLVC